MPRTALAIDIGATTVTATVRDLHGNLANLPVGGTTTPSSVLVVDRGRPRAALPGDPLTMQQLGSIIDRLDVESTVVNGVAWSTETLLEIVLAPVLTSAAQILGGEPEQIVLVVPFSWGEDRRLRLQLAVAGALHRPARMVSSDRAIAYAVPAPAIGEHRIVIDCGASALEAVALGGGRRGPRVVARAAVDSGGDIFDRILLADALNDDGYPDLAMDPQWAFAGVPRVRAGREALAEYEAVQISLPNPVGQVTLSRSGVNVTGREYFTHAFDTLFADLFAAGPAVDAARSRSLLLHGGLAHSSAVAAAARPRSEVGVQVLQQPRHLLCRGALAFEAADFDSTSDPDPAPPQPIEPDHEDDIDHGHGQSGSKRTLAVYGGIGALVVALAVGGGLALSSAMTGSADARDSELSTITTAVLPGESSIAGTTVKSWTAGSDRGDSTMRSESGSKIETLSCGSGRTASGAEADGLRWSSSRVFISNDDTDPTTSWEAFDPSATENVVVTAAIVSREDRDSVWQAINRANGLCPSTQDDLVRTIVVVPQDGPDPGPPTYSESLPTAGGTTPETGREGKGTEQGGITMGRERQAWRGIVPFNSSGTGTDMHVTCVLDIDGIVLRRACATSATSAAADKLAQSAAAAFNPTPEAHR
ncbi:hypothetical protein [Prescottella equi]